MAIIWILHLGPLRSFVLNNAGIVDKIIGMHLIYLNRFFKTIARVWAAAVVILLTPIFISHATDYYVDKDAAGANSGTSWVDAWQSFADINWAVITPGDTISISGGSDSKIYTEMLDVGTSGTSSDTILISKGATAGHNGSVILDGQLTLSYGVRVENDDYVTVRGLHVRNYADNGQIRVRYSSGVVIENNDINVTGHGGVYLHSNDNVTVRNNRITTPGFIDAQTDGIYSQLNTGNTYEYNHIVISNEETTGHDDGIQLYRDTDISMRYNYIEQDNTKTFNAQGIYATECSGTIEAFNNIIYGPNTWNGLLTLRIISEGNAALHAYHNTLVGGGWGTLVIDNAPGSVVKNNIFVCFKVDAWVFRLYPDGAHPDPENIDYNLYYAPNSTDITAYEGTGKTWQEWKGLGYEANGLNADPLLTGVLSRNFRLQGNSPAINAGVDLGQAYAVDRNGVRRPVGAAWDMGAFEYCPPLSGKNLLLLMP